MKEDIKQENLEFSVTSDDCLGVPSSEGSHNPDIFVDLIDRQKSYIQELLVE